MKTRHYAEQSRDWPQGGRHILAQYDDTTVRVYQAYRPEIADHAVARQRFGGAFSFQRMSWIKPNFLWMMYRSGWATKEGQERILQVTLRREFFDALLARAVASSWDPARHPRREDWQAAIADSDVRLQWDPDHDPAGRPLARRAVQLGLRGESLRRYGTTELLAVADITGFVCEQRARITDPAALLLPEERVYTPTPVAAANVGIDIP
jgi:hypothetical protein